MSLTEYLKEPRNSKVRESILTHRLIYDLKVAAAFYQYNLSVIPVDTDIEGFDLLVDDREHVRKLQVKSVMGAASTWSIHKRLLLPDNTTAVKMGFPGIPPWTGVQGGVLLLHASADATDLEVVSTSIQMCLSSRHCTLRS